MLGFLPAPKLEATFMILLATNALVFASLIVRAALSGAARPRMPTGYSGDDDEKNPAFHSEFQARIGQMWAEKDTLLDQLNLQNFP